MSSVLTPRACSTAYSSSPKSSPTGPTTRTSVKNDAASEKWTAEPPSMRSRWPNGVCTASKAIDPTTTRLMRPRRLALDLDRDPAPRVTSHLSWADWRCANQPHNRLPMRGVVINEWGGPEVLQLADDLPEPEPGPGERRIRVSAAGVNFADTH